MGVNCTGKEGLVDALQMQILILFPILIMSLVLILTLSSSILMIQHPPRSLPHPILHHRLRTTAMSKSSDPLLPSVSLLCLCLHKGEQGVEVLEESN